MTFSTTIGFRFAGTCFSQFRSDLSVRLRDIAEKQVAAKLKPIEVQQAVGTRLANGVTLNICIWSSNCILSPHDKMVTSGLFNIHKENVAEELGSQHKASCNL